MKRKKLLLGVSLDLDNQWSYMKIHGDSGWEKYPSYLHVFLPKVLEILTRVELKITFFIVGKDASLDKNKEYLSLITKAGHGVGNHSFNHESWIHTFSDEKIKFEIEETENQIINLFNIRPLGFRGPGFSWSPSLLKILYNHGYLYDASTFPTFIGPLARMFYFSNSNLNSEMKKQRDNLFGSFSDGFMLNKPYYWKINFDKKLMELPVSTIPIIKIPFHLSYLLYLFSYSERLMNLYLHIAIQMCKLTNTQPSFLLHPLDLIGKDLVPELSFFPAMNLHTDLKTEVFTKVINNLSDHFEMVDLDTYAERINNGMLKVESIV